MRLIRKPMFALSTALLLSATVACSSGDQGTEGPGATGDGSESALLKTAQEQGTVTWYSTYTAELMEKVGAAFTDEYGINVEVFRSPSAALIQRYSTERDAGSTVADLLCHSIVDGMAAPEFLTLSDKDLPSLEEWPKEEIYTDTAVNAGIYPFVIAYNTERLKGDDVPKVWEDVLDPAVRDGIAHPAWDASPTYVEFLKMLKDEVGEDFLKELGSLDSTAYDSGVPALQGLASGEHTIVLGSFPNFVQPLIDAGAPIDFVVPDTTTANLNYCAVPAEAPNQEAGLFFLNYLMSEEGQALVHAETGTSVLPGVEGTLPMPEGYVPPKVAEAVAERDELLGLVGVK